MFFEIIHPKKKKKNEELESANQHQCFLASLPICDEMGLLCVRGGHFGFHWCRNHVAVDERSIWYVFYTLLLLTPISGIPSCIVHQVYHLVPGNFVGSISDFTDPSNQSEDAFRQRANKLSSVTPLDVYPLSNCLGVLPVCTCLLSFSADWDSTISTRCEKPHHCLQAPWHLHPFLCLPYMKRLDC